MSLKYIVVALTLLLLCRHSNCYGSQITVSSTGSATITNFYQDFSYCTCDLTPSLCDNYCCCDPACSSGNKAAWASASICLTSAETLQEFCNETSRGGFGVFNDLACVYQSNRGEIGYYYQYPSTASISFLSTGKFSSISPNTLTQEFQSAASGVTLGSPYSVSSPYLEATSSTFFYAPQPGPGGSCVPGPLNLSSSQTSKCFVTPTSANCATLNNNYASTLCLDGACSSNANSAPTIAAASISGTSCNNVLTGLTISYTLSSSGRAYTLSSVTFTPTLSNINLGSTSVVSVTQTVTTPASFSGNPGYQLGKVITITPSLSSFADASGSCYTTSSATGSTNILFGQAATYRCGSSSPCSNSYYIDSLLSSTISIQKYASQSTETITVSGTAAGSNGCNYEGYRLQIVYTYSGWELDPQYYVVGAKLVPFSSPDTPTNPTVKYFSIDWIYVDPKTINTPPSNLFYEYFSELWLPLKQKFGLSS